MNDPPKRDETTRDAAIVGNWRGGLALDVASKADIVHAICPYLRNLRPCDMCPEWQADKHYGRVQKACFGLAEEVMNICQTGHPHGSVDPAPAKDVVEKQAEVDRLRHALTLCLPIMEAEFGTFGPREPETRAIQAAKDALHV